MPAAKLFGEPSSPVSNGMQCKYIDNYRNAKGKPKYFIQLLNKNPDKLLIQRQIQARV